MPDGKGMVTRVSSAKNKMVGHDIFAYRLQ